MTGLHLTNNGSLRAAILGANDGLVSNFILVMGVAGGSDNPQFVLLAGIAGLFAGAFSMAAGEYVSMRSQRDVYEYQIARETSHITNFPQETEDTLVEIYHFYYTLFLSPPNTIFHIGLFFGTFCCALIRLAFLFA